MARLTQTDLRIINSALAMLEADDIDRDEHGNPIDRDAAAQEAYMDRVQAVRRKIWERLK